jgi:TetR/AcrR family transcriptional regulator, lmrAB and yxaGH operons repressor
MSREKMTKRSTKNRQTRMRLLDTASKLFRSQGFHATGLDQILRRSHTPKGSLYHYFPGGKDQLAIETLRYVAGEVGQTMSAVLSSHSDPLETLRTFFEHTAESLLASDFRDGCPIAAVTLEVASDRPSVREACKQGFQIWLEVMVKYLIDAGLCEARAKSIATLVLASLEGGLILSRAQKSVEPINTIASELEQMIQSSLAAHN